MCKRLCHFLHIIILKKYRTCYSGERCRVWLDNVPIRVNFTHCAPFSEFIASLMSTACVSSNVDWILYRSYIEDTAKTTLCYFYEMNMALHDLIPLTCPLCWRTFSATPAVCQTPTKPFFVWHEVRYSLKGCIHLQLSGHSWIWCSFLGEFTKLLKASNIFIMSIRLSARNNMAPT
jgi:hypothetical protein